MKKNALQETVSKEYARMLKDTESRKSGGAYQTGPGTIAGLAGKNNIDMRLGLVEQDAESSCLDLDPAEETDAMPHFFNPVFAPFGYPLHTGRTLLNTARSRWSV